MRTQKGITLVALVITIIVLLILAGVTIAALGGSNGILTNATAAKQADEIGNAKDQINLAANDAISDFYKKTYLNDTTTGLDATKLQAAVSEKVGDIIKDGKIGNASVSIVGTSITVKSSDNKKQAIGTIGGTNEGGVTWGAITDVPPAGTGG